MINKLKPITKVINEGLKLLNNKGHIVITIYPGHKEGKEESIKIKKYLQEKTINYTEYHNDNNKISPYVINIKK